MVLQPARACGVGRDRVRLPGRTLEAGRYTQEPKVFITYTEPLQNVRGDTKRRQGAIVKIRISANRKERSTKRLHPCAVPPSYSTTSFIFFGRSYLTPRKSKESHTSYQITPGPAAMGSGNQAPVKTIQPSQYICIDNSCSFLFIIRLPLIQSDSITI